MKIKSSKANSKTAKKSTKNKEDAFEKKWRKGITGDELRKRVHTHIAKLPWGNFKIPADGYTFTYKLVPETKGFSVKCLDWDCVFTQGDTIKECKKNAAEVTELFLEKALTDSLGKTQHPNFKKHRKSNNQFQLSFFGR